MQKQLTVQIKKLKIALADETANAENERSVNTQLRADLNLSQTATVEAKSIQAQQSDEIEKLKVALSNEAVNVENEYNLKLEVSKERLAKRISVVGQELVAY